MGKVSGIGEVSGRKGWPIAQCVCVGITLFFLGFIWGAKYQDTKYAEWEMEQRLIDFESLPLHVGDLVVHRLDPDRRGIVTKVGKGEFVVRIVVTERLGKRKDYEISDSVPVEWKRWKDSKSD